MRAFLYLFFIFFFLPAQAQERKRIVVDLGTNKPVSYATIKVLHTNKGQIASENGEFTIDIKPNDSVLISCVGYHDALLIGKEINGKISLAPKPKVLEDVIVRRKKVINRYIIGNGADLVEKNIKCNYTRGGNNDCIPWGPGGGAEFAEPMMLPDPLRTYHISKVYIPVGKGCWGAIFLQIYEPDSITGKPGNLILKKHISVQRRNYSKGKITIDLTRDDIYFTNAKKIFISISWPTNAPGGNCATSIPLFKSLKAICYSRNLQSPDYSWSLFQFHEGRFHTMFAAEIEALED